MSNPESALSELQARLTELRGVTSLTEYARRIKVAPKTLIGIVKAKPGYLGAIKPKGNNAARLAKWLAGRSESVGRIVQFANQGAQRPINRLEVLKELGLDPTIANVQQGLSRAAQVDEFITQRDPVLERILRGGGDRKPGQIKIGVAEWSAFSGEGGNFLGKRLMERLVGCLRLSGERPDIAPLPLSDSLSVDPIRDGRVDAVFGLYDTPARRMAGFDFVHLPGLAARMGALVFGLPTCEWRDIVDSDEGLGSGMKAFVVDREAGDLLMSGTFGYPASRLERIKATTGIDEIARILVNSASPLARSNTAKPFALVGDSFMVDQVNDQIAKLSAASETDYVKSVSIRKLDEIGTTRDEVTPHFRVGIGVSANAHRWKAILSDTFVEELFWNGRIATARSYARVLQEPSSLTVVPLEPQLGSRVASTFAREVLRAMEQNLKSGRTVSKAYLPRWLSSVLDRIQHHWLSGSEEVLGEFSNLKELAVTSRAARVQHRERV